MDPIIQIQTSPATALFPHGHKSFRALARAVHPDTYTGSDPKAAAEAFARLNTLWESYTQPSTSTNLIKTRRHEYVLADSVKDGAFERFKATYDAGHKKAYVVVAGTQDADLAVAYANALRTIKDKVPAEYQSFFPTLMELFSYGGVAGTKGVAVRYQPEDGFYSLAEVAEDYPEGLHGRDVVWIFKRVLVVLGNTRDAGLVHGAVNEDNVYIHPELHGLILDGWGYSVAKGEHLIAVPAGRKSDYPAPALAKSENLDALDVQLAAKMMMRLLRSDVPERLRRYFTALSKASSPHPRQLMQELDEVAFEVYGEPRFHEFRMRRGYP